MLACRASLRLLLLLSLLRTGRIGHEWQQLLATAWTCRVHFEPVCQEKRKRAMRWREVSKRSRGKSESKQSLRMRQQCVTARRTIDAAAMEVMRALTRQLTHLFAHFIIRQANSTE